MNNITLAHTNLNRVVWLITAFGALIAAASGLANPAIYDPVVSQQIVPGVFTQDLVVALAALLMLVLAVIYRRGAVVPIIQFGILGFFFYAYGLYAIEQVYTSLYPLYLALLALSFYGLALGLASLQSPAWSRLSAPNWMRFLAAGYAIFIALMFNVIWLGQLQPLIQNAERIEYTFSVYIIDLSFIMPAMAIAGVLALRRHVLGIVSLPALFILGAGILSPLAIAELIKPARYGLPTLTGDLWLFGILSLVFVALTVAYIALLELET